MLCKKFKTWVLGLTGYFSCKIEAFERLESYSYFKGIMSGILLIKASIACWVEFADFLVGFAFWAPLVASPGSPAK